MLKLELGFRFRLGLKRAHPAEQPAVAGAVEDLMTGHRCEQALLGEGKGEGKGGGEGEGEGKGEG